MDGGKNDYDILILCLIALKGKRLTTFCASLALLQPLLLLTHWIFRSLMLPYKSSSHSAPTVVTDSLDFQVADAPLQIQFASAKCVRCASLRSGGRRLAVRKMIECHIFAQPRTPFCHYVAFPLKGKREIWREKQGCIYFMYHSGVPPLVAGATTFPPQAGAL